MSGFIIGIVVFHLLLGLIFGGGEIIDPASFPELSADVAAEVNSLTTPEVVIATHSYPINDGILAEIQRRIVEAQQEGERITLLTLSDPETGTWVSYSADTGEVRCGDTFEEVTAPRRRNA